MPQQPPELYGWNINQIADVCGVSERTAARWKAGTTCPPKSALMMMAGDLGMLDRKWRGWRIRADKLISPEGWEMTTGEVLAVPLMRAQIASYQLEDRRRRRLDNEWEGKEEQPLPSQWVIQMK